MKLTIIGIAAAMTLAVIDPVRAQFPAGQPQQPPATYANPGGYGAATAGDAYRRGLINRWELDRLEGPQPSAVLGPSPNGNKGAGGG